jgi:tRNA pseudouridine38-40 synthase
VRIRIDLAYDGTDLHGWAVQPGLRTVQGDLEAALAMALRVPRIGVVCAGRTDTGVHARGQVVHLDVDGEVVAGSAGRSQDPPLEALVRRLNGILRPDVRVRRAVAAPAGFDARFSALWRRYAYRIADDPVTVDPLTRNHVLTWSKPLDLDAMNEAADLFLGEHDFASFCRRRDGATTIRTLLDLTWVREPTGVAVATVRADAFCHSMVRALVGACVAVGEDRLDVDDLAEIRDAGMRTSDFKVLAARGLTLTEVGYPADDLLASRAEQTRARRNLED